MTAWFQFALDALVSLVSTVFSLDLGLGFSLGDIEIAFLLIGLVAVAFVAKFSHMGVRHDFTIGSSSGPKSND